MILFHEGSDKYLRMTHKSTYVNTPLAFFLTIFLEGKISQYIALKYAHPFLNTFHVLASPATC